MASNDLPTQKLRVAAVHAAPVFMDKAATVDKVISLIKRASEQGINLLVFPEAFVPGFPYWINCYPALQYVEVVNMYKEQSVVVDGDEIKRIKSACQSAAVTVSLGISERVAGGHTLLNSQVTIDSDGSLLGVHRKLQPTFAERTVWGQGGGYTLRNFPTAAGYNLGGLVCWEHTMCLARQALIDGNQHIHAGAWPALSTVKGFESLADSQIEAMMKSHALGAQAFVITASNYVDQPCLDWMEKNLGPQEFVKPGGGWSAVLHPFCGFLAGPHTGAEEKLVTADVDLSQLGLVKAWVDSAGHYKRPEVLELSIDRKPLWPDEKSEGGGRVCGSAPLPSDAKEES